MDGSPITKAEDNEWGLNFLRETFDRNRAIGFAWERGIVRNNESKIVWDSDAEDVASIIDAEIWSD